MNTLKKVTEIFQVPRLLIPIFLLYLSPDKTIIEKDIQRWLQITGNDETCKVSSWRKLVFLLWKFPEYRNLFYFRIVREKSIVKRALVEFSKLFCKPLVTLFILTPEIGPGLFIQHGFSTIISAKSIGQNCWINQQVTIGYANETDTPIIGDNVRITAGAKVFGDITIGDNSIVGANAVVTKDVPPNCTVVGIPAYIIKYNGEKVVKPL